MTPLELETTMSDSIKESLAKNCLRLGNECRDLAQENARLKAEISILEGRVRYWKIEAECDHGRWMRTLEDLEHIRKLK